MSAENEDKKGFFKSEWLVVLLIFLIAFVTGFLYTRARLEASGDSPAAIDTPANKAEPSMDSAMGETDEQVL